MTVTDNVKELIDQINDDSGYNSRKFHIAVVGMLLIILAGVVAGNWPTFSPQYPTAVWGIVSIAVGYMGGNVAAKYVATKAVGSVLGAPAVTEASPPGTQPAAPPPLPVPVPVVVVDQVPSVAPGAPQNPPPAPSQAPGAHP
jgi:hypothetical protein